MTEIPMIIARGRYISIIFYMRTLIVRSVAICGILPKIPDKHTAAHGALRIVPSCVSASFGVSIPPASGRVNANLFFKQSEGSPRANDTPTDLFEVFFVCEAVECGGLTPLFFGPTSRALTNFRREPRPSKAASSRRTPEFLLNRRERTEHKEAGTVISSRGKKRGPRFLCVPCVLCGESETVVGI
jgi:hypothetical protein